MSRPRFAGLSLRQRTVVVIASACCLIGVAIYLAVAIQAETSSKAESLWRNQERLFAAAAAVQLGAILERHHHHLEIFSSQYAKAPTADPAEILRRYAQTEESDRLEVIDGNGRVLAASDDAIGSDRLREPWFREVAAPRAGIVHATIESPSPHGRRLRSVVHAIPLTNAPAAGQAAVLASWVDVERLVQELAADGSMLNATIIGPGVGGPRYHSQSTDAVRCFGCHTEAAVVKLLGTREQGTIAHSGRATHGQTFSFASFNLAGERARLILPALDARRDLFARAAGRIVALIVVTVLLAVIAGVMIFRSSRSELRATIEAREWEEKRVLESALRKAERHYRDIVETSHDLIWILGADGRIIYANGRMSEVTGYASEELVGHAFAGFVADGPVQFLIDLLEARRGKRVVETELSLTMRQGGCAILELTAVCDDDVDGGRSVICSARDLTNRRENEATARRREREFRQLVDAVPGIVWSADAATVAFTFVSEKAREILGYDPKAWLGSSKFWLDHLHPEDRDWVPAFCAEQTELGVPHEFEYRMIASDGGVVWLHDVVNVEVDDGLPTRLFGVMIDITRSKHAETAERESEIRFRAIFEQSPWAIALRSPDQKLTHMNPAGCRMFGYEQKEILCVEPGDLELPAGVQNFLPSDSSQWGEAVTPRNFEQRFVRRDGSSFWGRGTRSVVRGEAGRPQFMLAVVEDVTSEKKAAEERRLLATAVEYAGEAVIVTDLSGVIAYVNPAFEAITGYDRHEVRGQTTSLLKSGMHDSEFYRSMWERILSGVTWNGRIVNRRKDGHPYEADATISPIFDEVGGITGFVAVQRDMSERLLLLEKLQRAEEAQRFGRLVAGVAHEVRNPLAAIQAAIGALEIDLGSESEQAPFFKIIQTQVERLARLMRDLLDLAKPVQASSLAVQPLAEVCASAIALWRHANPGQPLLRLQFRCTDDAPVRLDPLRMQQVIVNLLDNATQHSSPDTPVAIEVSRVGEEARLTVRDGGEGLSEAVLARLFEPFFTTRRGGTGLGLPMVRSIIEQLGGRVSLVDNHPLQGATAEILLPLESGGAEVSL